MAPSRPFRAAKITDGCFAAVIRAFIASPKFQNYSPATREVWGRELRLAERPDTLGAISANVMRPALVQAFMDGMADRPCRQAAALAALRRRALGHCAGSVASADHHGRRNRPLT